MVSLSFYELRQQKSLKKTSFWIYISIPSRHTHTHIHPSRWTVSDRTVAPVSTLRPQQPPPPSQCIIDASVLFWGSAGRVHASCRLCQIEWDEWWLFWFPVLIRPVWPAGRRCHKTDGIILLDFCQFFPCDSLTAHWYICNCWHDELYIENIKYSMTALIFSLICGCILCQC